MNASGRIARLSTDGAALLVLRHEDMRWLTGFTGSTGQLVVDRKNQRAWLLVDGRYSERAASETNESGVEVEIVVVEAGKSFSETVAMLPTGNEISVDPAHLTAAHYTSLEALMTVYREPTTLDELRRIKDADEIEALATAAVIADSALQQVVADGLLGKTEREVRNQLEQVMRNNGAHDIGFATIVATGPHGARPHHEPTDVAIENGHGVVIDMGALMNGYRSDMTRTVLVGNVSPEYRTMFETVREAQEAGLRAVSSGVRGAAVDAAVRAVFASTGTEHEFVHGTGHGIGLYIHEPPILSPRCVATLNAGEVVTVEPGLYRKGVGGVRIEDLVVVTDTTCRILTLSPKDLTCPRSQRTI
jgi:Xaa-Pro aminopeptidase